MELLLKDQTIALLPERALLWKEESIVAVSDLHLGKTATFRKAGIPVQDAVMHSDLNKLTKLLIEKQAKRCVIVGDFLHHSTGLTAQTVAIIEEWLNRLPCPVELILGNHDRALKSIDHANWKMIIHEKNLILPPFAFSHIPTDLPNLFTWSGHIHPQVIVGNRRKSIRVPCFLIQNNSGLLPAFSSFAGGCTIKHKDGERIFAIAEDSVVELPS